MQSELPSCTFPHLLRCTLSFEGGSWASTDQYNPILTFLLRHPCLNSICIQHRRSSKSWPSTSRSPQIPLPNLQRIWTPQKLLQSILTDNLKEVRLEWRKMESIETAFDTLRSLTRTDIPFVSFNDCINYYPFTPILDSLSRKIPHTKTIHFWIRGLYDEPDWRDVRFTFLPISPI